MLAEEKAALLLTSLDPQDAENILARLGPEQGNRLRAQIARVSQRPDAPEQLNEVLLEFDRFLQQVEHEPTPPERQEARPEPPSPPPAPPVPLEPGDLVPHLRTLPADELSAALQHEQPRIAALVLETLDSVQAGEVLLHLPPATRNDVSLQLGRTVPIDPEVMQCIARAVIDKRQQEETAPPPPSEQTRYKRMAEMLRLLPKPERVEILTALEHDSAVATGVKEYLYQFEDVLAIDDRSMQKLLAEIDSKSLATSLKDAPDAIRNKVMNNLSKRARESLTEEMEFLGSVSPAQIEQARKTIAESIQRLDQAGELVMT